MILYRLLCCGDIYIKLNPLRIGSVSRKFLFREYREKYKWILTFTLLLKILHIIIDRKISSVPFTYLFIIKIFMSYQNSDRCIQVITFTYLLSFLILHWWDLYCFVTNNHLKYKKY